MYSYVNVVFLIGTNMFSEVCKRITKELTASAPSAMKIEVVTPPGNIVLAVGAKSFRYADMLFLLKINVITDSTDLLLAEVTVAVNTASRYSQQCVAGW